MSVCGCAASACLARRVRRTGRARGRNRHKILLETPKVERPRLKRSGECQAVPTRRSAPPWTQKPAASEGSGKPRG